MTTNSDAALTGYPAHLSDSALIRNNPTRDESKSLQMASIVVWSLFALVIIASLAA